MTSREKAEARKAKAIERNKEGTFYDAKNMKRTQKFLASLGEEGRKGFVKYCEAHANLSPAELAKCMTADMLASEVSEKMKAELTDGVLPDSDGLTVHQLADSITGDFLTSRQAIQASQSSASR
jgi:hypothetical protein